MQSRNLDQTSCFLPYPDKYLEEYYDANGDINEMRRKRYAQNKDVINARKRELYASKKAEKLEKLRRSDILISGARITDLNSAEADEFAEMYYEEIRHFSTDSKKIADNPLFPSTIGSALGALFSTYHSEV